MSSSRGPCSIVFTALLFVGLLLLAGCRKPPEPTPGWVRLNALVALHPNRALVADIDARVEGLRRQRARLQQRASLAVPASEIVYPTPALAALPVPEPSPVPGISPHKLNQQDLKALSRTLRNEAERRYEREARMIRADFERALQERLIQLARAAAESRRQIDEQYRDILFTLDIRDALAPHITFRPNQRPDITVPQSTPSSTASPSLLWRNLSATPPALGQPGDTLLQKISLLAGDPRRNYALAVSKIDEELAEARKIAEQENKRALMERLQHRRQQMEADLLKRIDEEVAGMNIGEEGAPQPTPLPSMRFPEVAGEHLRVSAAGMAEQFTATKVRDAQGRREAIEACDRSIAELHAQRQHIVADMRADTRAAVVSLAVQHGYQVSFDTRDGTEITPAVRNWLAAYWPPANQ